MSLLLLQTWFDFWLQPSDGNSPCKSSPSGSGSEKKRFVFDQWHCQQSSNADSFKHISSFYHCTESIPHCSIWGPLQNSLDSMDQRSKEFVGILNALGFSVSSQICPWFHVTEICQLLVLFNPRPYMEGWGAAGSPLHVRHYS